MMAVEKTEFVFPDEVEEKKGKEVAAESEIEIVDDTPERDRGRKPLDKEVTDPTEDELAEYSEKVQSRIKELTHAKHDERRKRESLEREQAEAMRIAQAIADENKRLKKQLETGSTNYASQSQQLAEIQLTNAKAKLKQAHETGDSDAFVDAQQEVASAVLALERVKSFKPTPLQKGDEADNVDANTPQRPPVAKVDAKAASWRDKNSWFGSNKRMSAFALGVHQELVEKGYNTQSDEYYDAIDAEMRATFPTAFKDSATSAEPRAERQRPATVVAPVTRSTSPNKIVLTKTQVQIAKRLGVPLELYARKVAEQKEQDNG
jgi:hypothetical protein